MRYLSINNIKNKKDNFILSFQKEIEALNFHIQQLEKIQSIVDKYDGKVVNKRFVNFLEKEKVANENMLLPSITWERNTIEDNTRFFELNTKVFNRCYSVAVKNKNGNGYECAKYISYDTVSARLYTNSDFRLIAEKSKEGIQNAIKYAKERISDYQDAIKNFDKYIAEGEKIETEIYEYQSKVNNLLRLNISVSTRY